MTSQASKPSLVRNSCIVYTTPHYTDQAANFSSILMLFSSYSTFLNAWDLSLSSSLSILCYSPFCLFQSPLIWMACVKNTTLKHTTCKNTLCLTNTLRLRTPFNSNSGSMLSSLHFTVLLRTVGGNVPVLSARRDLPARSIRSGVSLLSRLTCPPCSSRCFSVRRD